MKKFFISGLLVAVALIVAGCTCSREKEKKELTVLPECPGGSCVEGKKVDKPRTLKISPQKMAVNRELLLQAFNEKRKEPQEPPAEQNAAVKKNESPEEEKAKSNTPQRMRPAAPPRPALKAIRIPAPQGAAPAPKAEGATQ